MNDAVDRLIVEREELDQGFPGGVILSVGGHIFFAGAAVFVALLGPREPVLRVQDGFVVALPPGGGGSPAASNPAPAPPRPEPPKPEPAQPKPEPPPKIKKPPKEQKRQGLPEVDARKATKPKRAPSPEPRSGAAATGTGASAQTPGLEFGPPGAGVPGGTDLLGDWYLAGVQRKIWLIWSGQIRADMSQSATVMFTILADGSVTDLRVVQSSGVFMLDLAAQRAISSAAPFGPLPKTYGTDRYTVQAIFKATTH
jgi:TonB family protein